MNNSRLKFVLLILLISFFNVNFANAQFWKRKSTKVENKKAVKSDVKVEQNKSATKKVKEKTPLKYPETVKKNSYRIDVLMPLELSKYVKDNKRLLLEYNQNVLNSIHFYEGMRVAIDTLEKSKNGFDVYVHDVTDVAGKIQYLTDNDILKESDLIIGLLQSNELGAIADYANENKINFVSALSPADAGIKNNPYYILLQPKLESHIDYLLNYLGKFKNHQYILLHQDNEVEQSVNDRIVEYYKDTPGFKSLLLNQEVEPQQLVAQLSEDKVNIVYLTMLNDSEAEKILEKLNSFGQQYKIKVVGMPSWRGSKFLYDGTQLQQITMLVSVPFHFDFTNAHIKQIVSNYKKYSKSSPSEMVFRGYEAFVMFTGFLNHYGIYFNSQMNKENLAPFNHFDIQPSYDINNDFLYLENKQLSIYEFENGRMNILE